MRVSSGHREWIGYLAAEHRPESYLEVGVREGESLGAVICVGSVKRLLLCDTWDRVAGGTGRGSHDHISALLVRQGYSGKVEFLDGRSQITLPAHLEGGSGYHSAVRPPRYDLTHVDGGHSYPEALADLRNVWALTEGRMIVHDIAFEPVWKAVVEFGRDLAGASADCVFGDWGSICFTRELS